MKTAAIATVGRALNAASVVAPRLTARVTYELFRRPPRRGEIRPGETRVHESARVSTLPLNGKTIRVYAWGTGQNPVLLMHGWSSRASRFAYVIDSLVDKGFSPVGFDAPGHGDSPGIGSTVLDYLAIARLLQDRHGRFSAIVANSFGVLGAMYSVRSGIQTDRLALVSGVGELPYLISEFTRQLRLNTRLSVHIEQKMRSFLHAAGPWEQFSVTHSPADITVPLLVIHDENDEVVEFRQAQLIRAAHPNAEWFPTTGLGHRQMLSNPAVVAAITTFLTQ